MQHISSAVLPKAGTFKSLGLTAPIQALVPYTISTTLAHQPKRKSLEAPIDNGTYVKPIKQSFVRNPRLMPMTKLMLTLLNGWGGHGGKIETTTGIIAKHLSRSVRQVFRYLKDAVEEGYLYYNRTKDRVGRYIGIRIHLNFAAIRAAAYKKVKAKPKSAEKLAMTQASDTNKNLYINTTMDEGLMKQLLQFGKTLGYYERDTGAQGGQRDDLSRE